MQDRERGGGARDDADARIRQLWWRNGLVWLALLFLLSLSFVLAYLPIGSVKTAAGPLIAVVKGGIVAVLFMELIRPRSLLRLAAGAGLVFLAVLFALSLVDIVSRALARA